MAWLCVASFKRPRAAIGSMVPSKSRGLLRGKLRISQLHPQAPQDRLIAVKIGNGSLVCAPVALFFGCRFYAADASRVLRVEYTNAAMKIRVSTKITVGAGALSMKKLM